jgi:arylsulfatase A-like enzyme
MRPSFDLLERAHLADVESGGLVMDFGTPARHKYTSGGWKTSWDGDTDQSGVTFTYATSNTCRVYFPVDRAGALTLQFRMRPHGSRTMSVYLNNEPISAVRMQGEEFKEYDVPIAADKVKTGENYLLLRFNGTTSVGHWQAAAAVDWIRVVPEGTATTAPTLYGELVGEMTTGGDRRRVLAVHPGTTLSWYVEVPAAAKLGFGVAVEGGNAPADVVATVTPEGGTASKVYERRVRPGRRAEWQDEQIDLSSYAGKVIRLDLAARGGGGDGQRIGWATPAVLVAAPAAAERPAPAKNVIVLLIDTLRADHLSPYAKTRVQTPAFARFAQQGVVFENAQAQECWTKPSVATVLSGLFPDSHATKTFDARLPESVTILPEVFRDQGVRTVTRIANGYVSDKFGFNQGWEDYANFIRENRPTGAEHVFGSTLEWIRAHRSERFFAYIQTIDPHVPYDPPEEFLRMYDANPYDGPIVPRETPDILERIKRHRQELTDRDKERLEALYDGEISYHDRYFALLLDKLREWHLLDDTLIVVTADHGEEFFDHGSVGHGHSLYQELLHVPLAIRYPAAMPAGRRVARPVSLVDIAPTVFDLAGVEPPEELEGHSLLEPVRGVPSACPEVAFSSFLEDRRAIRAASWKMVYRGGSTDLFDLANDPHERTNVVADHPIALRYMRTLLGQFLGSPDHAEWCAPARPDEEPVSRHEAERADIDEQMRGQLEALGYAGGDAHAGPTGGGAQPATAGGTEPQLPPD